MRKMGRSRSQSPPNSHLHAQFHSPDTNMTYVHITVHVPKLLYTTKAGRYYQAPPKRQAGQQLGQGDSLRHYGGHTVQGEPRPHTGSRELVGARLGPDTVPVSAPARPLEAAPARHWSPAPV